MPTPAEIAAVRASLARAKVDLTQARLNSARQNLADIRSVAPYDDPSTEVQEAPQPKFSAHQIPGAVHEYMSSIPAHRRSAIQDVIVEGPGVVKDFLGTLGGLAQRAGRYGQMALASRGMAPLPTPEAEVLPPITSPTLAAVRRRQAPQIEAERSAQVLDAERRIAEIAQQAVPAAPEVPVQPVGQYTDLINRAASGDQAAMVDLAKAQRSRDAYARTVPARFASGGRASYMGHPEEGVLGADVGSMSEPQYQAHMEKILRRQEAEAARQEAEAAAIPDVLPDGSPNTYRYTWGQIRQIGTLQEEAKAYSQRYSWRTDPMASVTSRERIAFQQALEDIQARREEVLSTPDSADKEAALRALEAQENRLYTVFE